MSRDAPTHLDLFSGIGGFSLAASWAGLRTIGFVENEGYCQRVLRKNFPGIPIHEDIRDFDATGFRGVRLVTGGYPCQPFSQAGQRRGKEDDRHLWPEMFRVIRECRPTWVLGENVAGHITMGLDEVLADLEGDGYSTRAFVIPACAKDAPHRRDRVWIVAYSESARTGDFCGASRNEGWQSGKDRREGIRQAHGEAGAGGGVSTGEDVGDSEGHRTGDVCEDLRTGRDEIHAPDHSGRIGRRNDQSENGETLAYSGCAGVHKRRQPNDVGAEGQGPGRVGTDGIQERQVIEGEALADSEGIGKRSGTQSGCNGDWDEFLEGARTRSNPDNRSEPEALADSGHSESPRRIKFEKGQQPGSRGESWSESASCSLPRERRIPESGLGRALSDGIPTWMDEPNIPRVAKGVPDRVNRLKAIGNAIVPEVAYEIILAMMK